SVIFFAGLGWLASRQIPSAPAAAPDLEISFNYWQSTKDVIRISRESKSVFQSILAISWFWFLGSVILAQFPAYALTVLYGDGQVATLLLATFSIGIGAGAILCNWMSGGRIEIGIMPIGAVGMSVFTWLLGSTGLPPTEELRTLGELAATPGIGMISFYMVMLAISSGLFIVPLYTFMQVGSKEESRSRVIASNNIINALFMVTAGIMAAAMLSLGYTVLDIFKVTAVLNALVTLYILTVVPEFVIRLIGWVLIHSLYRIKKTDLHHVPTEGPALIVCNHVSYADSTILLALLPRPARFVMYEPIYKLPVANWLFRALNTIPINTKRADEAVFNAAFDEVSKALDNNELVVLFPEGGMTRTGDMLKFQPGIDQILKKNPVPVVPLALRGMWGSWFSRANGNALQGVPRDLFKKISVVSGPIVAPEDANRISMFEKVAALRGDEK
ncbi:MAG: 1-acyl-sn-glycerol-3-phosphate acyltransferase, partial [Pseudomonadota bacterium]